MAFLSVICGLMGGLFVALHHQATRFEPKFLKQRPLFLTLFVAVVTGLVVFPLGSYLRIPLPLSIRDLFSPVDLSSDTLNATNWTEDGQFNALLRYFFIIYFLAIVSSTLPLPSGLFLPVLVPPMFTNAEFFRCLHVVPLLVEFTAS